MKKIETSKAAIAAADGQTPEAPVKRTRTLSPLEAAVAEWKRAEKLADCLRVRADKAKVAADRLFNQSSAAADKARIAWEKIEAAKAGK